MYSISYCYVYADHLTVINVILLRTYHFLLQTCDIPEGGLLNLSAVLHKCVLVDVCIYTCISTCVYVSVCVNGSCDGVSHCSCVEVVPFVLCIMESFGGGDQ